MGDLTENFSLSEFAQGDPYRPVPAEYRGNVQLLANNLQVLRDVVGRIVITSAYRTRAKNDSLPGSSRTSKHLTAKAADFTVPGERNEDVYCTILNFIPALMEEGGVGWYGEKTPTSTPHIHYDVRGSAARWNKSGGPVPVCRGDVLPTPEEEDEDMAVMIQANDEDQVYVTNFVVKAPVVSPAHRQYLIASGVAGPIPVDKEYVEAIQDACGGDGALAAHAADAHAHTTH